MDRALLENNKWALSTSRTQLSNDSKRQEKGFCDNDLMLMETFIYQKGGKKNVLYKTEIKKENVALEIN